MNYMNMALLHHKKIIAVSVLLLLSGGGALPSYCNTLWCKELDSPIINHTERDSIRVVTLQVFFDLGKTEIDPKLNGNAESIERFFTALDSITKEPGTEIFKKVHIRSSSSPEGRTLLNEELSRKRAESLASLLKERTFPDAQFEINSIGEDWQSLANLIRTSNIKSKEIAIKIIEQTPTYIFDGKKIVGGRKKEAMELRRGKTWLELADTYFPLLRQATLTLSYSYLHPELTAPENCLPALRATSLLQDPVQVRSFPSSLPHPAYPETQASGRKGKPLFAIKSNLLFDAATLLNLGVEIPISQRFSIATDIVFPWWKNSNNDVTIQMLAGTLEGRYWFGDRSTKEQLTGLFAGLYAGAGYFDFQLGRLTDGRGIQGDFYIMSGLSAGYAHKISNSLRLEYSLGLGYLQCKHCDYISVDDTKYGTIKVLPYPWQEKKTSLFIPTKAAISLVWMLQKKGGER